MSDELFQDFLKLNADFVNMKAELEPYQMLPLQKLVKYLDGLPPAHRRLCTSKGPCACLGCVRHRCTQEQLDKYKSGVLQQEALVEVAKSMGIDFGARPV